MKGIDAISPILIHSARRRAKLAVPGPAEAWSIAAEGDLVVAIVPLRQSRVARASHVPNSPLFTMHAIGLREMLQIKAGCRTWFAVATATESVL